MKQVKEIALIEDGVVLITMAEAAAMIGCHWQTVRNMIERGQLRGHMRGVRTAKNSHRWYVEYQQVHEIAGATEDYADNYMSISRACKRLRCAPPTIWRLISEGRLDIAGVRNPTLVSTADVELIAKELDGCMTVVKAAKYIGVSSQRVQQLIADGVLRAYQHPINLHYVCLNPREVQEYKQQRDSKKSKQLKTSKK